MHYAHYNGRTLAQIRNQLIRQGMKPAERHALLDEIQAYRRKVRSEVAVAMHHRNTWNKFAKPLEEEIQRVRVAMHYRANIRRNIVLMGYKELLEQLMDMFRGFAAGKRSPKEIAEKNAVPNRGVHWVDWIDRIFPDDKERILGDFELVRERGRKLYRPFLRRTPDDKE